MLDLTAKAESQSRREPACQTRPGAPARRGAGGRRQQGRAARRGLPRITLAQDLLPLIHDYVSRFQRQHGAQIETGGMLLGEFSRERGVPCFRLNGLIDAGPGADYSSESILFDNEYQFQVLQALRRTQPQTGNMGCIHLHPDQMDECSLGDRMADVAAAKSSQTGALVFGLITVDNPRFDLASLYYRNLKLDFFVLGESTGFKYVHVRPKLRRLPLAPMAPAPIWPRPPRPVPAPPSGAGRQDSARAMARIGRHYAGYPKLLSDKRRLVAEVRTMAERYGDRAVLHYRKNLLYWEYTVVESGRHFPVEVRYPRRYPLEPPQLFSRLPLPPSPHQLLGNEICWTNRSVQGDWNPARDTAATCLHAAHRWFACLLVYLTLGAWPEEANDEYPRSF